MYYLMDKSFEIYLALGLWFLIIGCVYLGIQAFLSGFYERKLQPGTYWDIIRWPITLLEDIGSIVKYIIEIGRSK